MLVHVLMGGPEKRLSLTVLAAVLDYPSPIPGLLMMTPDIIFDFGMLALLAQTNKNRVRSQEMVSST